MIEKEFVMKAATPLVLLGLMIVSCAAFAQEADEDWVRRYDCYRAKTEIVVDGEGDEFAWTLAPTVGEFTRFQKKDSLVVPYRTTAKMLWDDENLYFLISVDDPDIWSTMTVGDRDCLCREETIEIFIDADGDEKDYAEIHINCLDTINDIWIPKNDFKFHDGSPVDWLKLYEWNQEGMQHAVKNHGTVNNKNDVDKGSVFEFAMPWKGFGKIAGTANTPPKPGDVWRINVNRYERPRGENVVKQRGDASAELSGWAPMNLRSYHVPEQFGYVKFSDK